MPAVTLDTVSAKKRLSAVRRNSSIKQTEENVQERLGLRRQASIVRKAAILESLGKWDTDEDLIFNKPANNKAPKTTKQAMRRKSFDDTPLIKEEPEVDNAKKGPRAKSAEPVRRSLDPTTPLVPKQKASKKEVGSSTSSPISPPKRSSISPKRSSMTSSPRASATASASTPKRASASSKDSSSRQNESSPKKRRSSRKMKRASNRSVQKDNPNPSLADHLQENDVDASKRSTHTTNSNSASVVSAPSKLPPNRPKRRSSKSLLKSAKSLINGQKPRRAKSSDLDEIAGGQTKAKKTKRRSKSADNGLDFGPDILVDVKSEKSKKKGRTKRRSSQKRASAAAQSNNNNDAENDATEANPQPQDRRASLAGTKKRAHSAGPLKRKTGGDDDDVKPALPARAASMMLNRDNTRRGKANSLHDLVQYSAEEIHSTSYFASNHVLVNRERMKRGLRPLTRNIAMDTLARESAEAMAKSAGTSPLRTTYVGNVLRGESIRAVHRAVMLNKQGRERANMLNPYFQDFGVGTAKGKDGMLYVCQLFSERLELSCTNLAMDEGKSD